MKKEEKKEESKYKFLLKNLGILTIGNFGSKILSFLLIPLYTYVLTTAEYGTYDIYSTTISLLKPILTLCISSAIMRFLLDGKRKEKVISSGLKVITRSIVIFVILIIINYAFNFLDVLNTHIIYFFLLYICNLIYNFLCQLSRGLEKTKSIAIAGVINSFVLLTLNIYFLLFLKIGLDGYFLANIISLIIPSIYLIFSTKVYKYIHRKDYDQTLEKEMKQYSKPLIVNDLSWWVTNISDRYIVTFMCGLSANGIYSVSYKIPSIMNIMQDIFNGVWTMSAVKEFDVDDKNNFFGNIYSIYNMIMVLTCSLLILFSVLIAKILFLQSFFEAWKCSNFLLISVVFGALIGVLDGIFLAQKKSKIVGFTTAIGSIINIILNIILIHFIGIIGAAISTMISYFIIWCVKIYKIKKDVNLNINIRLDLTSYLLLVIQAIILLLPINRYFAYAIDFFCLIIIFSIYFPLIRKVINLSLNKLKVLHNKKTIRE